MASVFKARGKARYTILYVDENGRRRKKAGVTDKAVSERIAHDLENKVALKRQGLIDPRDKAYARHASHSLAVHLADWTESLRSKGVKPVCVRQFSVSAMRIIALANGAKLADIETGKSMVGEKLSHAKAELQKRMASAKIADLTAENVQRAQALLIGEGRSLQTANNHRTAIKSFAKWLHNTHRVREILLRGVNGYNAKEDPRHNRRTVSLDELRRLIEAADRSPVRCRLNGRTRSLAYRLAASTGLRYSEIASILPESFDWKAPSVTVAAGYTKNGQTATQSLPDDLAHDLAAYVATIEPGKPVFPLPADKGSRLLRYDLKAAGIPYVDAWGRYFDFHSLRCETATLLDAAGVTPRVVQKIMRHSSLELTGRYTRPRTVDIEAAAGMLPSLKPEGDKPEAMTMTGTDPRPILLPTATLDATLAVAHESNANGRNTLRQIGRNSSNCCPACPSRDHVRDLVRRSDSKDRLKPSLKSTIG